MSRWKIWLTCCFIASYLGFLSWGIVGHALKVGLCGNAVSYFAVWDMFCGWSAWDTRIHIVAESTNGEFYDVREPWGEFHPFGHVARIHYDDGKQLLPKHINNILRNTEHEPIAQVYVIEEVWPKQYNLPPKLFDYYFNRTCDKLSYFHLQAVCRDDGSLLRGYPNWYTQQTLNSIADNPRLQQQTKQATSFYNTLFTPSSSLGGDSVGYPANSGLLTN